LEHREQSRQKNDDRNNPGKNRAVDEELRKIHSRLPCSWKKAPLTPSPPDTGGGGVDRMSWEISAGAWLACGQATHGDSYLAATSFPASTSLPASCSAEISLACTGMSGLTCCKPSTITRSPGCSPASTMRPPSLTWRPRLTSR